MEKFSVVLLAVAAGRGLLHGREITAAESAMFENRNEPGASSDLPHAFARSPTKS
jgi:hypothetical protein